MRLVFLDAGPLGMISNPRGKALARACAAWARKLIADDVRVFVPEIADYEIRRELIRVGSTRGLERLDRIKAGFEYAPISTEVMVRAAELWADARNAGRPTASPEALDGDCILAATALLSAGPDDSLTVATANVGHLSRFLDARPWQEIEA